jgi:phosphatidylglycerol:prolipoprotein diacylglycerol transferase
MNSISHYVVEFDPFLIRFPEGWFLDGIRWYGLSYMAGFLVALWLFNLYSAKGKSPLSKDDNASLISYLLFGIIIGGRLGYMLFYSFDAFCANPLTFFEVWKGGMASHGGFIGTIIALVLFARAHKCSFLQVSDFVVASAGVGIFLGRLANFINGELWGKISNVSWAMIFPHSAPVGTAIADIPPRHPSQLYEAGAEGLFLFIYMQYRLWKCNLPKGQIAGEFLVIYGILRIVCEVFREPDVGVSLILGLSRGSFYSLFAIVIGIGFIIWARLKNKESK